MHKSLMQSSAVEHKELPPSEFRRLVEVAKLDHDERRIELAATPQECAALAGRFGILGVEGLSGEAFVRGMGGGAARARVTFHATVVQASVVTLEPVRNRVDEAFEVDFLAASDSVATKGFDEEGVDPDAPEPPGDVIDGRFDLGGMIAEYLALSIDQYPRAPGEEFGELQDAGAGEVEKDVEKQKGPFATLRNWRSRA